MGKRKAAKKPQGPKKVDFCQVAYVADVTNIYCQKDPLPTQFACLFCNHESSVTVKLDKKTGTGSLSCKVCGQNFQTGVNYLSAAVDVYADWIDACDAVAKDAAGHAPVSAMPRARRDSLDEDLEDDFIENDEQDGEAAYAD